MAKVTINQIPKSVQVLALIIIGANVHLVRIADLSYWLFFRSSASQLLTLAFELKTEEQDLKLSFLYKNSQPFTIEIEPKIFEQN
ncbi:MAG: hypothetical protein ACSHW0_15950 [Thalassotalea sp.]